MEKNKNIKKGLVIGIIVCSLMLVGFLGSYAFFIGQVGQNKKQEVTVETGTMTLTFSDGNNGFNKELNFGESAEKTFTIENTGTKEGIVSVSWMNLLNNYLEGSMTYTFLESDTEDGEYIEIVSNKNVPVTEEAEDKVLASGITIPAGTKKYYKLIIQLNYKEFDQTADLQARLETQFKITEGVLTDLTPAEKTLAKLGKAVKEGKPTFAEPATTDETADGLYAMEDDYGTSYYYRGAVEDNYVKFAGFYWRIIRVNGDGTLRIAYDGTEPFENGTSSVNRLAMNGITFNNFTDDNKYVGYMYGPESGHSDSKEQAQSNDFNSNIKEKVDEWYQTNIENKGYSEFISDTLFCNDRSTADSPGLWATKYYDTTLGYGLNTTVYGPYQRYINPDDTIKDNPLPTLICKQQNDRFTVDDVNVGNGSLKYPVGLLTVDETCLAGSGKYFVGESVNDLYFLYKGYQYWTMSSTWSYDNGNSGVYSISNTGFINSLENLNNLNYYNGGVVPVINLSVDYVKKMSGNGSISSPFEVV